MLEHYVNDDNIRRVIMDRNIHIQVPPMVAARMVVAPTVDTLPVTMVQAVMARDSTEICMVNSMVVA